VYGEVKPRGNLLKTTRHKKPGGLQQHHDPWDSILMVCDLTPALRKEEDKVFSWFQCQNLFFAFCRAVFFYFLLVMQEILFPYPSLNSMIWDSSLSALNKYSYTGQIFPRIC